MVKEKKEAKKSCLLIQRWPKSCLLTWEALFGRPVRAGPWSLVVSPLQASWAAGTQGATLEGGKKLVPLGGHLVMHVYMIPFYLTFKLRFPSHD